MASSSLILAEHNSFLKVGGLFGNEKGFLKITGEDRTDFLHRLTSQDIKNLASGTRTSSALLDPTGAILVFFDVYNCGQFFLIVIDKEQLKACHDTLEKFHFAEDISIADASAEFKFVSIQGPHVEGLTKISLGRLPKRENEIVGLEETFIASRSDFNESTKGFHLFIKQEFFGEIVKVLERERLRFLSLELWSLLRVESGHFSFGVDIDSKNIILEAGLADYVARDKGCYPGQEVVERIFTYGNIAKKLMGLHFSTRKDTKDTFEDTEDTFKDTFLEKPSKIKLVGEDAGQTVDAGYITSARRIPWTDQVFGFGIIRKPFYEVGKKLKVENSDVIVEVAPLPNSFDIRKPLGPAKH